MANEDRSLKALEYEQFVAESFAALHDAGFGTVTQNKHITGLKSGHDHQFDVAIELEIIGLHIIVVVECKHYRRRVEISDVLEFASRIDDVSAHKGVMVTTVGYQEGAIKIAKANRITLLITAPEETPAQRRLREYDAGYASGLSAGVHAYDWLAEHRREPQEHPERPRTVRQASDTPRSHTTLARYREDAAALGTRSFALAWRDVVAALARDIVGDHLKQQPRLLAPVCEVCGVAFLRNVRLLGHCAKCNAVMAAERFEGGVWYVCDCGKMLHRSDLYVYQSACGCGNSITADTWLRLRAQHVAKLYREHNIS